MPYHELSDVPAGDHHNRPAKASTEWCHPSSRYEDVSPSFSLAFKEKAIKPFVCGQVCVVVVSSAGKKGGGGTGCLNTERILAPSKNRNKIHMRCLYCRSSLNFA